MLIRVLATIGAMVGIFIGAIMLVFIAIGIAAGIDYLIKKSSEKFQKTIKTVGKVILALCGIFAVIKCFLSLYQSLWKG